MYSPANNYRKKFVSLFVNINLKVLGIEVFSLKKEMVVGNTNKTMTILIMATYYDNTYST